MPHPAAEIVKRATAELQAAIFIPGDRDDLRVDLDEFAAAALRQATALLTRAQQDLEMANGDASAVAEGMRLVREASDALESTRGFVRWMPSDVVYARADALRLLDRLTGRS